MSNENARRSSLRETPARTLAASKNQIWPPELEEVFIAALKAIPNIGLRKPYVDGRPYGRNQLLADYIYSKMGVTRTHKQISSHIQVLKKSRAWDAELMRLLGDANDAATMDADEYAAIVKRVVEMRKSVTTKGSEINILRDFTNEIVNQSTNLRSRSITRTTNLVMRSKKSKRRQHRDSGYGEELQTIDTNKNTNNVENNDEVDEFNSYEGPYLSMSEDEDGNRMEVETSSQASQDEHCSVTASSIETASADMDTGMTLDDHQAAEHLLHLPSYYPTQLSHHKSLYPMTFSTTLEQQYTTDETFVADILLDLPSLIFSKSPQPIVRPQPLLTNPPMPTPNTGNILPSIKVLFAQIEEMERQSEHCKAI
ncbi:2735_t:CDS:2 [Paraglomus brasilianum]|uniref:2735_t:CDS:1 n=1 Tax=Paraglomus brasilianum TaxID=144538 RepID=A0A9N8WDM3_9GLOM|nr:2735_t:CDS:2 [Paraglomus brasilianum]